MRGFIALVMALAAAVALAASAAAPARADDGLVLTRPGAGGASAHYARPGDLALDRRAGYAKHYRLDRSRGYGHPSRILGAPLDVGATPFERLGRNAEQNEIDIRPPAGGPDALARPRAPYDPSRPPSAQGAPPPRSR